MPEFIELKNDYPTRRGRLPKEYYVRLEQIKEIHLYRNKQHLLDIPLVEANLDEE
jgi:hypothetical protein